jgi:predicted transposase YdaD
MSTHFDATTKVLVDWQPQDWLPLFGLKAAPCQMINVDLATISTEADRLIRVEGTAPYILHIEFQSGHNGNEVPERLLRYNALVVAKYKLPVISSVILLRKQADSPRLTGVLTIESPRSIEEVDETSAESQEKIPYLTFNYRIIRVWELPVEKLLQGGAALLPLAPLANRADISVESVLSQVERRIEQDVAAPRRKELWTSLSLLMGLSFSEGEIYRLIRGAVSQMKESVIYQDIFAQGEARGEIQGEARGERMVLLRLGTKRFGPVPEAIQKIIELATSERLILWIDRLLDVNSWEELLAQ